MKVALWLALSQVLHGTVDGFTVPQHAFQQGTWSRGYLSRFRPLFAEEETKETDNSKAELPKVPVPPPTTPGPAALSEKLEEEDSMDMEQTANQLEPLRVAVKETKPKVQLPPEDQKLVVASGFGGAFLGLIVGAIIIFEFPDLDVVMEPLVWPLATAIVFAAAGFVGGSTEGQPGEIVRGSLGKATSAVGTGIISAIQGAINAAIQSAENKVKQTTEEIKAIPSKVATAAKEKVEDAVDEISQLPGKVKDAAFETAENVKQKTIEKAEEVVEEIKATPGRVVESSRKAVVDAVDDTLDAVEKVVEEVVSIPKKAVESVEETVNNLVGTKKPTTPQPPKIPPPMPDGKPEKPRTPPPISDLPKPTVPKLGIPKVEPPKITLPTLEPPKLEVPKVSLPKVEPLKPVAKKTLESQPAKETKPKAKDAASEILEIQFAVRRATEEARKEALQRQTQTEQKPSQSQSDKEAQAAQLSKTKDEAKKVSDAKKEAAMKAAEAKRQRDAELAQRKAAAEAEKKKREEDTAKRNAEKEAAAAEAKAKLDAIKEKQVKAAEKSLRSSSPRRTISLGDLFNLGKSEEDTAPTPKQSIPTKVQAPSGVPTLSNWRQNDDGSITGKISGSPSFKEGETITTSPVASGATSGSVVKTNSGSR